MEVLFLICLIVLNGLFAMSEIALVAAKPSRLKNLAKTSKSAKIALQLKDNPTHFLSTIQIGITAIGLLSGIVGEATLSQPFAHWLVSHGVQAQSANVFSTVCVVITITYFAIVVGELVPKRLAQANAEKIAVLAARPISWVSWLTAPFVILLAKSTEVSLLLFGKKDEIEDVVTEDDIQAVLSEGSQSGAIEPREQVMMNNILLLNDRSAASLMTPRANIDYLDLAEPPDVLLNKISSNKHSVFPVYLGNIDNVVGTLSAKDLLKQIYELPTTGLGALVKPPVYIHESVKGLQLLNYLQTSRTEMALIIDEYGDIQGLVTYYDLLEAIAGELAIYPSDIWAKNNLENRWIMDALIPIAELKQKLDIQVLDGEQQEGYQTLNGLLLWKFGKVPESGSTVQIQNWRFQVLEVKSNRVQSVMVTLVDSEKPAR